MLKGLLSALEDALGPAKKRRRARAVPGQEGLSHVAHCLQHAVWKAGRAGG